MYYLYSYVTFKTFGLLNIEITRAAHAAEYNCSIIGHNTNQK